jgi:hypothetical protein
MKEPYVKPSVNNCSSLMAIVIMAPSSIVNYLFKNNRNNRLLIISVICSIRRIIIIVCFQGLFNWRVALETYQKWNHIFVWLRKIQQTFLIKDYVSVEEYTTNR